MSRLIDTHFHLDHYKNHEMIFKEINKLEQYTLCVTNSPGVFLSCKNIYSETKYVKFALGMHPCEVKSRKIIKDFEYCMEKTDYIGEIGLDFSYRYIDNKDTQIYIFNRIIDLATKHNQLVSIHSKKSEDVLIDILNKYKHPKCIIHWFNGNSDQLEELIKLGCYFSVNSNMFNSNKDYSHLNNIPLDRILIESDGPYINMNGKKYTPMMLQQIYNIVENKLKVSNLDNVIHENFKRLLLL